MTKLLDMLRSLGIGPRVLGYRAVILAVQLAREDEDRLRNLKREIFGPVGVRMGLSWQAVERDLRTAIRIAWKKNRRLLNKIAGYELMREPSAGEFIEMLYNRCSRDEGGAYNTTEYIRSLDPSNLNW